MATLGIKGHKTRGREVIQLLKMLGGENKYYAQGNCTEVLYFIYDNKGIQYLMKSDARTDLMKVFTLEEFEEKFPYKVGDKVTLDKSPCIITGMSWYCDDVIYYVKGVDFSKGVCSTDKDLQPYEEEANMKTDCKNCGLHYDSVRCFDMDHCLNNKPKSYAVGLKDGEVIECGVNMEDNKAIGSRIDFSLTERIELDLGNTHEVVVENGKTYVVKKKPPYPKTYEECCEVLAGRKPTPNEVLFDKMELCLFDVNDNQSMDFLPPQLSQLNGLFRLLMCRNAYWKIAGKEMRLGKPWKPDWSTEYETKYVIEVYRNNVRTNSQGYSNTILAFPTPEMRNAFYGNFRELIEDCKELL